MISDDGEADCRERRNRGRRKSLLTGIVTDLNGGFPTRCTIRQMTEGGARIEVPKGLPLAPNVYLIITRMGVAHRAQVVWYRGAHAGLRLAGPIDLISNTDRRFDVLQDIWNTR